MSRRTQRSFEGWATLGYLIPGLRRLLSRKGKRANEILRKAHWV